MKVKIGIGRIYNPQGCSIIGDEEINLKFNLGEIEVTANYGPNLRHIVGTMNLDPPYPKGTDPKDHKTRARPNKYPPEHLFPSDLYLELEASQMIEVSEKLGRSFFSKEVEAKTEIFKELNKKKSILYEALDFFAAILGLRFNHMLISKIITEQSYAYREEGSPYSLSINYNINVVEPFLWHTKNVKTNLLKIYLLPKWKWADASKILSWFVRAWQTDDQILKFISLFTALECVIPKLPMVESKINEKNKKILSKLVNDNVEGTNRNNITKMIKEIKIPSIPLTTRFESWAIEEKIEGYINDVKAFIRFNRMRNLLLHAGDTEIDFNVYLESEDVRSLEDIAERYINLALFGDKKVYKLKNRKNKSSEIQISMHTTD